MMTLKKGDKVVMHTCPESEKHNGRVWACRTDEYEMCGSRVVMLEGYSSCFSVRFLQKVNVTPHRLRHSLATHLLDKGASEVDIQHILGHSNINTTMRYARANMSNVEHSYRRLNP